MIDITSLDELIKFNHDFIDNSVINQLTIKVRLITDKDFDDFCEKLECCSVIKYLGLNNCLLNQVQIKRLSKALQNKAPVQSLNLSTAIANTTDFCVIYSALKNNVILECLSISSLDSQSAQALANILPSTSLTTLQLDNITIHDERGLRIITMAVQQNRQIKSFSISNCHLDKNNIIDIGKMLQQSSVEHLDLEKNNLGDLLVAKLANSLPKSQLKTLSLRFNNYSHTGVTALTNALELMSSPLLELDLSGNQIRKQGIEALSSYLHKNPPLEKLYLCGTRITSQDSLALFQAIEDNTHLMELNLFYNKLDDSSAKYIAKMLANNKFLASLNLKDNCMSLDGENVIIATLINSNFSLVDLKLDRDNHQKYINRNLSLVKDMFENLNKNHSIHIPHELRSLLHQFFFPIHTLKKQLPDDFTSEERNLKEFQH